MLRFFPKTPVLNLVLPVILSGVALSDVQMPASSGQGSVRMTAPKVSVPTASTRRPAAVQARPQQQAGTSSRILYPWKLQVTCTIFWIGEQPTDRNPTPNCKSSWDQNWSANFGGYDNPDPTQRIANHTTGEFRPKNFIPKLNPFYVALPYNDVLGWAAHKPEASRVIPWFGRMRPEPGKTVCKGRWLQIYNGSRSCYAQWEDCGPWVTDDWEFVFGSKPPKATQNGAAGIDISPSVRDYLGLRSGQKVHWRFVDDGQVPYGPWKKYGQEIPATASASDIAAQQKYLEYVRKLRDEQFLKKPSEAVRN